LPKKGSKRGLGGKKKTPNQLKRAWESWGTDSRGGEAERRCKIGGRTAVTVKRETAWKKVGKCAVEVTHEKNEH